MKNKHEKARAIAAKIFDVGENIDTDLGRPHRIAFMVKGKKDTDKERMSCGLGESPLADVIADALLEIED